MTKSALWLAASLTIAASGCVRTATNPATGKIDVDVESPTKRGEDWKGELKGRDMYASVKGTTRALYADGRTSVTVMLENAMAGATYWWDLREGRCGSGGGVLGSASSYTALNVGNDGRAGVTVTIMARLDEAKTYSITVYGSSSDMTNIVACGDLDD